MVILQGQRYGPHAEIIVFAAKRLRLLGTWSFSLFEGKIKEYRTKKNTAAQFPAYLFHVLIADCTNFKILMAGLYTFDLRLSIFF